MFWSTSKNFREKYKKNINYSPNINMPATHVGLFKDLTRNMKYVLIHEEEF